MNFVLPGKIDHFLEVLAKLFEDGNEQDCAWIVTNAVHKVEEGVHFDNWNGGTHLHNLVLSLDLEMYRKYHTNRSDLESKIINGLNGLVRTEGETFMGVSIMPLEKANPDWRSQSALFQAREYQVPATTQERIWTGDGFRLFLSHHNDDKAAMTALKNELLDYGISAFVAHDDIQASKEWQAELEDALRSMHGFAVYLTPNAQKRVWVNQEIGFALALRTPFLSIAPIGDSSSPKGFIARKQSLKSSLTDLALKVAKHFLSEGRSFAKFVKAIEDCDSFDSANNLAKLLDVLPKELVEEQAIQLVTAFNGNSQVNWSFGWNGTKESIYGPGLVHFLNLKFPGKFKYGSSNHSIIQAK